MKDSTIETWADLLEAAKKAQCALTELGCAACKPWYRGQADVRWKLVPSVYRGGHDNPGRGETWLMGQFMMRAPSRYDHCPRNVEYAVWLTLARHYDLRTRLLDWTESILVAAFFAVSDEKEDRHDGAIWALNPHGLNESECNDGAVSPLFSPPASKVVYAAFGVSEKVRGKIQTAPRDETPTAARMEVIPGVTTAIYSDTTLIPGDEEAANRILAARAPERDLRMLVQQSAYTIHGRDVAVEKLCGAMKGCDGKTAFLRKYVIPANKKEVLGKDLASVGYTTARLFPDLQHLAEWLNTEADR